ncbi:hypothetical protein [Pedobacter frigoris]|uniref:Uncharacterized protein n=1 Tax=Pedobacter frigoris TaxID=2571272 RepID=A0A4U1CGY9_9SPHI|nr:hypothetical protein [Pedobacter frigoris]TKC05827.1 hypothetical protein FA047_10790 [Pedobacter frigoris]
MPLLLPSILSKDFCINPLIKIIVQSKALFTKALYSAAVPNTASDRQTLPQVYNLMQLIGSLYLKDGRNSVRDDRLTAFKNANNPDGRIARMKE